MKTITPEDVRLAGEVIIKFMEQNAKEKSEKLDDCDGLCAQLIFRGISFLNGEATFTLTIERKE